jgi:hypothetical protein
MNLETYSVDFPRESILMNKTIPNEILIEEFVNLLNENAIDECLKDLAFQLGHARMTESRMVRDNIVMDSSSIIGFCEVIPWSKVNLQSVDRFIPGHRLSLSYLQADGPAKLALLSNL